MKVTCPPAFTRGFSMKTSRKVSTESLGFFQVSVVWALVPSR